MTYLWISFLIEDRQNACQLSYILDKEYKKGQRGINSFSFELFDPYLFFRNHFRGQHGSWIGIYLCHKCLSQLDYRLIISTSKVYFGTT